MTREEIQAVKPEEILSEFHRSLLTKHAVKLFIALWYHGAFKNMNVLVVDDRFITSRARIPFERLQAAQTELVTAGLLKIDPLRDCARVEFIELPETPTESDEQTWQRYTDAIKS